MANKTYPKYKKARATDGAANFSLTAAEGTTGVFCVLVDTGTYTYSDSHEFYSDLSGIGGTEQEITTKTVSDAGVFDGDDVDFGVIAAGPSLEAVVFFRKNAGANTTWRLIKYIDTGVTNIPVTPDGVKNIDIDWNASGIFST